MLWVKENAVVEMLRSIKLLLRGGMFISFGLFHSSSEKKMYYFNFLRSFFGLV